MLCAPVEDMYAVSGGFLSWRGTPRRILFIFGFWWAVPSIIAVFLPIFQRNRLQSDPSYRGEPYHLPYLARRVARPCSEYTVQ